MPSVSAIIALLLAGFANPGLAFSAPLIRFSQVQSTVCLRLAFLDDGLTQKAIVGSHVLLSTVDQDIAKLSDNEFAPIFAGGIAVMCGG
jgi:hypothetical protein